MSLFLKQVLTLEYKIRLINYETQFCEYKNKRMKHAHFAFLNT